MMPTLLLSIISCYINQEELESNNILKSPYLYEMVNFFKNYYICQEIHKKIIKLLRN